jgi:UDP-2,4-diacetamido-2,4,6-trideoxy-beta-L-altropyranose hydrolase
MIKILIRADAGAEMGTGHVMRCLALAQAWQDQGGEVVFAVAQAPPALESRLLAEGMEVVRLAAPPGSAEDARETAVLARERGAEWLVVDGYQFGGNYQHLVKEAGLALLFVDDYGHAEHYWADLVLNQNPTAQEEFYLRREPYTRLLLGTRYALLRREFLQWRKLRREIPGVARKILVTLGGGDPDNVTAQVLQALGEVNVDGLEAVVVAGGANPYLEQMETAIKSLLFPGRLIINATNMPELMAWADVGITGGGSTCWEAAFLGLPCLVIVLADNQRPIAEKLHELKSVINLGGHRNLNNASLTKSIYQLLDSVDLRREMYSTCRELLDGEGTDRVLMHLQGDLVRLRPARETDCRLLWEWVNDPEVRAASFSQHYISWEEHATWFRQTVNDPYFVHFIVLNGQDEPVGQVRFDLKGEINAVINLSIDRRKRGLGLAKIIINKAIINIFNNTQIKVVEAYIRSDNLKSIKAFEKADFKMIDNNKIRGNETLYYVRSEIDK